MLLKQLPKWLTEDLENIYYNDKILSWNPNKTYEDFKRRIKERTSLSEKEFYKVIQDGINSIKLPKDNAICLYFLKSQFVLVINTNANIITTIRDGKWDKPGNNCKHRIIANEDLQRDTDLINIFNNHDQIGWIWDVNEKFDIEITQDCNYCYKVNY
jgi:hypothetical protein